MISNNLLLFSFNNNVEELNVYGKLTTKNPAVNKLVANNNFD